MTNRRLAKVPAGSETKWLNNFALSSNLNITFLRVVKDPSTFFSLCDKIADFTIPILHKWNNHFHKIMLMSFLLVKNSE